MDPNLPRVSGTPILSQFWFGNSGVYPLVCLRVTTTQLESHCPGFPTMAQRQPLEYSLCSCFFFFILKYYLFHPSFLQYSFFVLIDALCLTLLVSLPEGKRHSSLKQRSGAIRKMKSTVFNSNPREKNPAKLTVNRCGYYSGLFYSSFLRFKRRLFVPVAQLHFIV